MCVCEWLIKKAVISICPKRMEMPIMLSQFLESDVNSYYVRVERSSTDMSIGEINKDSCFFRSFFRKKGMFLLAF